MKVLVLCDYFAATTIGGAEAVAREVYARLAGDGAVEAVVVGAVPGTPRPQSQPADRRLRVRAVTGRDLSGILGAQLVVSGSLARAARMAAEEVRPDVIHVNGLHFQSTAVGIRLARRLRLPLVATAHLGNLDTMPGRARAGAVAFDRAMTTWTRAADRVVAVSAHVATHLVSLGVDRSKVTVVSNGVDHERFHPRDRGPEAPCLRAVFIGRLTPNKGVRAAVEAIAQARATGRHIRLTVLGDGPLMGALRRRVDAPDLSGAVELAGAVADVPKWLRSADVALRPSYTEGLPLAVIESFACGVPVICSDAAGNLEVVTDGHDGLVVPMGDVPAAAAALCVLHDDRVRLAGLAAAAVETAAGYCWDTTAAGHLDALEQAIAARSSGPSRRTVPAR